MSIDLNILLSRNKIRLSTFCQELNIMTYEDLVLHCKARDIIPCSKEQWSEVFHSPPATAAERKPSKATTTKKPKTTTNATKKSRRAPAKKKTAKSTKASSTQKSK